MQERPRARDGGAAGADVAPESPRATLPRRRPGKIPEYKETGHFFVKGKRDERARSQSRRLHPMPRQAVYGKENQPAAWNHANVIEKLGFLADLNRVPGGSSEFTRLEFGSPRATLLITENGEFGRESAALEDGCARPANPARLASLPPWSRPAAPSAGLP